LAVNLQLYSLHVYVCSLFDSNSMCYFYVELRTARSTGCCWDWSSRTKEPGWWPGVPAV